MPVSLRRLVCTLKRFALCLVLILTGCASLYGPVLVVHKAGSTSAQRQQVLDECKIESFKSIPQAFVTTVTPGIAKPDRLVCRDEANRADCFIVEGIDWPPTVTTRDANEDLRKRFVGRCVASKGYELISKPICDAKQDIDLYRANANNQPDSNSIKCVPKGTE
jgi:hypothetical protein